MAMRVWTFAVIGLVFASLLGSSPLVSPGTTQAAPSTVAAFFDKVRGTTPPEQLGVIAKRNVLVFGASTKQLPTLRSSNPALKVILYEQPGGSNSEAKDYPYLNAHEAWWVHDDRGSRMRETGGFGSGTWLLNINQPEYRSYEQSKIQSEVFGNGYDGAFLDTSGPAWVKYREWVDVNRNRTTPPAHVIASWPDWMLSFQQEIAGILADRLHIFNSWPNTPGRYEEFKTHYEATIAAADGVQFDGFCYNRTQPWSLDKWQFQVSQAQRLIEMGKVVLLKTPLDNLRDDESTLHRLQKMCFGSFLLVADGRFGLFRNVDEADVVLWNERIFSAPVGTPTGRYYAEGAVFRRDFTNGMVLVNPTTETHHVKFSDPFKKMNGTVKTSVTLGPLSGMILLK